MKSELGLKGDLTFLTQKMLVAFCSILNGKKSKEQKENFFYSHRSQLQIRHIKSKVKTKWDKHLFIY